MYIVGLCSKRGDHVTTRNQTKGDSRMLKNVKAKRENLERAIADAGITNVKQLADKAGVDRRSVGNAVGGKPVRWATAVAIVRALNTAMSGDGEALTVYELFEAGESDA